MKNYHNSDTSSIYSNSGDEHKHKYDEKTDHNEATMNMKEDTVTIENELPNGHKDTAGTKTRTT